ncbi:hypothetical protein [Adlercreutzia murintestinalis]|jgi:hypothetical protein|uniref:hypothetical protein n=1 Tax=Adlercreutzia murintestinalis TaxID=2941325 RepID=UPI00203D5934|nr:hypothetical protein [Adlercreutzia murintestinalis]
MSGAISLIDELRVQGKLRALPIVSADASCAMLLAADGSQLFEYGGFGSGRWIRTGELCDGSILYLGSATHAGHIELKAFSVLIGGVWHRV